MARFLHYSCGSDLRKRRSVLLAFCFVFGAGSGIYFNTFADDVFFLSLMRSMRNHSVSIVVSLAILLLPFVFSALAVYLSAPGLLFPVCFVKSFLFTYVSFGFYLALNGSGWLLRLFFMFADVFSVPVLYYYWLRHISGIRKFSFTEWFAISLQAVLLGSFAYFYLIPHASGLILQKG